VTTLLTALSLLAIVASAVLAVRGAKRRRDRDLAFAACTIAMLLVSPLAWDHYFLTLIPSLWIAWQSCGCNRQAKAAVLAAIILLFTVDPAWLLQVGRSAYHAGEAWAGPCGTLVAASIPFCVLLGMYVIILKRLQGSRAVATFRAGKPKTISSRPGLATTFLARPAEAESAPQQPMI
jgi:asparagine N-glycosylation enzyme membrane subunit Stt3